jgi:hypothetical protein
MMMVIPQLTTDLGKTPLSREHWCPAIWRDWAARKHTTTEGDRDDIQRLVITIQTREAELDAVEEKLRKAEDALAQARRVNDSIHADLRAAQLRETRLIRERDEAQTARAHTASDNLELARRLERTDNRAAEWQAAYFALRDEVRRTAVPPQWVAVERSTTVTGEWGKERITTVVTREVAK